MRAIFLPTSHMNKEKCTIIATMQSQSQQKLFLSVNNGEWKTSLFITMIIIVSNKSQFMRNSIWHKKSKGFKKISYINV